MPLNFSQDQLQLRVHANVTDQHGNQAEVQNPQWVSSNTAMVVVAGTDNGGTTAILEHTNQNALGICSLTFTCDADLGAGVVALSRSEDVEVTAGQGANIVFQVQ